MYRLDKVVDIVRRSAPRAAWCLGANLVLIGASPAIAAEPNAPADLHAIPTVVAHPVLTDQAHAPAVYDSRVSQNLHKISTNAGSNEVWSQLEHASWVADGRANAPKIIYVFTDPNCPFCSKFWAEARPWVEAGRVQVRHVLVGILTPSSAGKAAALLAAHDPSSALHDYEARQTKTVDAQMAAGHPRPLEDASLKPLNPIPADFAKKLDANAALMQGMSMQATPAFVWRDESGNVHERVGLPPDQLETVLGPKPS